MNYVLVLKIKKTIICNRKYVKFSHPDLKQYNVRRILGSPRLYVKIVVQQDNRYDNHV